jgi:hypothetical protein
MNSKIERPCETMSVEELQAEFKRLKDNLCDLEDTHSFTFGRTTVHIGAEQAQSMQEEYEKVCRSYNEQIAAVEVLLRARGQ